MNVLRYVASNLEYEIPSIKKVLFVWPRLYQNHRLNSSAIKVGPLKSPKKPKTL